MNKLKKKLETRRVPKLQERWDEKQNFTEFATVTFASYAEEPKEKETTNQNIY